MKGFHLCCYDCIDCESGTYCKTPGEQLCNVMGQEVGSYLSDLPCRAKTQRFRTPPRTPSCEKASPTMCRFPHYNHCPYFNVGWRFGVGVGEPFQNVASAAFSPPEGRVGIRGPLSLKGTERAQGGTLQESPLPTRKRVRL